MQTGVGVNSKKYPLGQSQFGVRSVVIRQVKQLVAEVTQVSH